jgi:hypothetical protein
VAFVAGTIHLFGAEDMMASIFAELRRGTGSPKQPGLSIRRLTQNGEMSLTDCHGEFRSAVSDRSSARTWYCSRSERPSYLPREDQCLCARTAAAASFCACWKPSV